MVFHGLTQTGVSDTVGLAGALVRRYWAGGWDDGLLAVTDVVAARSGTVLAAARHGASAELRVSATLGAPLRLADLATDAAVVRRSFLGLEWVGRDVTPFYRVVRLRKSWLGRLREDYGPRAPGRGAAPVPVPPLLLEQAHDDPDLVVETMSAAEQAPFPPGPAG
ncbi:hypothetical protein GCM10009557_03400 [Virgisporangium ochraceum]